MTQATIDPGAEAARPDTREMLMVHQVFRRDLGGAPGLIRAVADGDTERAARIADHLRLLLQFLETHHHGEDELIWPLLMERVPADKETVATMEAQHARVSAGLAGVREQIDSWSASGDPAERERLAVTLAGLNTALFEHLDLEEAAVLPLIREYLTVAEWAKLGEHGMSSTSEEQRPTVLGMLMEDLPADQRAGFLSHLPPPVQQLWVNVWSSSCAGYVSAVRGSA